MLFTIYEYYLINLIKNQPNFMAGIEFKEQNMCPFIIPI